MRIRHTIPIATLMAVLVISCSKHPSAPPGPPVPLPRSTTDLGAVELTAETPKQFNLGFGKNVTITAGPISVGMLIKLMIVTTNADGSVQRSQGEIETVPGRQCAIGLGNTMIGLTPTLKTP